MGLSNERQLQEQDADAFQRALMRPIEPSVTLHDLKFVASVRRGI